MSFVYLDIDDPATDEFKGQLGYFVQPHFFLMDAEGNILQQWFGSVSEAEFVQAFEDALAE